MLLLIAILPAVFLMTMVYKLDTIEKEPTSLLVKLFIGGALTVFSAIVLGIIGTNVFLSLFVPGSLAYLVVDNFIVTALVEEGGKHFVLRKLSWKHSAFDYSFDAVVYAVTVSLGFATLENIFYVFENGLGTAIMRAVLSVPGHAIDGVYMGSYYGLAKLCEQMGYPELQRKWMRRSLLVPVLLHGFYDFCLSSDSGLLYLLFFVYEIVITIAAVRKLKQLSKVDQPLHAIPNHEDRQL